MCPLLDVIVAFLLLFFFVYLTCIYNPGLLQGQRRPLHTLFGVENT